jgi:hypothetical protein
MPDCLSARLDCNGSLETAQYGIACSPQVIRRLRALRSDINLDHAYRMLSALTPLSGLRTIQGALASRRRWLSLGGYLGPLPSVGQCQCPSYHTDASPRP